MNVLINLLNISNNNYSKEKRKLVQKLINDSEKKWKIVFDKTMNKIVA